MVIFFSGITVFRRLFECVRFTLTAVPGNNEVFLMKKSSFFSKMFPLASSQSHRSRSQRCRKLSCETLEDRRLLSVREFDLVPEITYSSQSMIPENVVCMAAADFTGDGVDELIVVGENTKSIQVLKYDLEAKNFNVLYKDTALDNKDTLDSNEMAYTFTNVDNDAWQDFVIVKPNSDNTKLDIIVYKGRSDGSFVRQSESASYNVPFIENNSGYIVHAVRVQSINTKDIVVQVDVLDTGEPKRAERENLTYIYKGLNSCRFESATPVTSMIGDSDNPDRKYTMVGTVEASVLNNSGTDYGEYIVYYDGNTSTTNPQLGFTINRNSTWVTYKYTFNYSNPIKWVRSAGDNRLIAGGYDEYGNDALLVIQLTSADSNRNVTAYPTVVKTGNFKIVDSVGVAVGSFSSVNSNDIVASTRNMNKFFEEQPSTSSIPYIMSPLGISSPAYNTSYLVDLDGDGVDDLVMMGDYYLWYLLGDNSSETGFTSSLEVVELGQSEVGKFEKAIFDDFNGDGKIDFAVRGTQTGSNLWVYVQTETAGNRVSFTRAATIEGGTLFSSVVDMVSGNFYESQENDCVDLALLVKTKDNDNVHYQYIVIYEGMENSVFRRVGISDAFTGATAIYAGNILNENDYDEIMLARFDSSKPQNKTRIEVYSVADVLNPTPVSDKVTVTSNMSIGVASGALGDTIYVDYNDINGDGKEDLAWLYKPKAGSNYSLGYALQQSSGGFSSTPTTTQSISGTNNQYTGLILDYVDDDVHLDLVTTVHNTSTGTGTTGIYVVWGQEGTETTKFNWLGAYNSPVTSAIDAGYGTSAIAFGHMTNYSSGVNKQKSSNDIAITYGNTIAVWSNQASSSGCSGTAYVLCQNATQTAAASLGDAYNTARLWIDEFSWFSLDIWADSGGSSDITSFSVSLDYDSDIFQVNGDLVAGSNVTLVNSNTEGSDKEVKTITVTGTVTPGHGRTDAILLARIFFKPATHDGSGVPLDSEGIFKSAKEILGTDAFSISTNKVILNDSMPVAEIGKTYNKSGATESLNSIEDLYLFPVVFDADDDGMVGTTDFSAISARYGHSVVNPTDPMFQGSNQVYKLFNIDGDRRISTTDYTTLSSLMGIRRRSDLPNLRQGAPCTVYERAGLDPMSLYRVVYPQPTPVVSGAVVADAVLAVADEIIEEVLSTPDLPQTTGSVNLYDNVLVELSSENLLSGSVDKNEQTGELPTVAQGTEPIVSQAVENLDVESELNLLVLTGKSNTAKRGINLSLETELENELV